MNISEEYRPKAGRDSRILVEFLPVIGDDVSEEEKFWIVDLAGCHFIEIFSLRDTTRSTWLYNIVRKRWVCGIDQ